LNDPRGSSTISEAVQPSQRQSPSSDPEPATSPNPAPSTPNPTQKKFAGHPTALRMAGEGNMAPPRQVQARGNSRRRVSSNANEAPLCCAGCNHTFFTP
jgi:hypothetical protein